MIVDGLTKALTHIKFYIFIKLIKINLKDEILEWGCKKFGPKNKC